jgi:hypothetical protein
LAVEYKDKARITYEYYEYYKGLSSDTPGLTYYEDEQPIKLKITLKGNAEKAVKIGRDDWYNLLKLTVRKGDCYEKGYYLSGFKRGDELEAEFIIIEAEDIDGGMIKPGEEKYAIISFLDENEKRFKGNYCYIFRYDISHENLSRIGTDTTSGSAIILVINPVTDKQKRDWYWRKAERAEEAENYELAIENYEEVMKLSHKVRTIKGRKVETSRGLKKELFFKFFKLANLYEKTKDYKNAKVNLKNALEYYKKGMLASDENLSRLKNKHDDASDEHEKKVLKRELDGLNKQREYEDGEINRMEQKLKELDVLIKKQ